MLSVEGLGIREILKFVVWIDFMELSIILKEQGIGLDYNRGILAAD